MNCYVTFNQQKDGRFTLGTAIHAFRKQCPGLKRTNSKIVKVTGEIAALIPKCTWCFNELSRINIRAAQQHRPTKKPQI